MGGWLIYNKKAIAVALVLLLASLLSSCVSSPTGSSIIDDTNQAALEEKLVELKDQLAQVQEKNNERQAPTTTLPPKKDLPSVVDRQAQAFEGKVHKELLKQAQEDPDEEQRVLVEIKNVQDLEHLEKVIEEVGGEIDDNLEIGSIVVVDLPGEAIQELADESEVEAIWPDREYSTLLNEALPAINIHTASDYNLTGQGIKIAILDTGIDSSHEMLVGRVIHAKDFSGSADAQDRQGHGTHVAGIAAGNGSLVGSAPGALLLNVKVLDDRGVGSTSSILAGIAWSLDPDGDPQTDDGADILSMSLGGPYHDPDGPLNVALQHAIDQGVVVVVASGNCGQGCGSFRGVTTPGDFEPLITVGAVTDTGVIAGFSSGQDFISYLKPDVVAPGVNITSSVLGGVASKSGTSMSTPLVAGIVALLLEEDAGLSHTQVKNRLEARALDKGVVGKDVRYGSGVVDIARLLDPTSENMTLPRTTSRDLSRITAQPLQPLSKEMHNLMKGLAINYTPPSGNQTYVNQSLDDQEWPGSCSGAQSFSSSISGLLGFSYDKDWFKYYVSEPGDLTVSLQVPSGVDYLFELQDSCSSSPLICDSYGNGGDEECTYYVASARYVYLNVHGYGFWDFDTNDQYSLSASLDPAQSSAELWLFLDNWQNDNSYTAGITLDGTSWGEVNLAPGQYGNFGPDGQPFTVTGDASHTFSIEFLNEDTGFTFTKQKTTYVSSGDTETADITTSYCGDNQCNWDEDQSSCSLDCSVAQVSADSRCLDGSSSPCVGVVGDSLGHNNQYHDKSGPLQGSFPRFVCYDWWYDGSSGGPISYDGHGWDKCIGDCSQCVSGNPSSSVVLVDANQGSRENRVLVAGWGGGSYVFDQDVLSFDIDIPSVCGNNICEDDETADSCSQDCVSNIKILDFVNPPSSLNEGEQVQLQVRMKNMGNSAGSTKMEVGIIPTNFFSSELGAQQYTTIASCCVENEYYGAAQVSLGAGEEQVVSVSLFAPNRDSTNNCGGSQSAWGSAFKITTNTYPACFEQVYNVKERSITIDAECRNDADCVADFGSGYVCDFAPNPNACIYQDVCAHACSVGVYGCDAEGDVALCVQGELCGEWEKKNVCGESYYCKTGESSCQLDVKTTTLQLEDAQGIVYKQAGDVLEINLISSGTESITLSYDASVFTPLSGGCGPSAITVSSDRICTFSISDNAAGEYTLSIVGGDSKALEVVDQSDVLIVTNKAKLYERFPYNAKAVDNLLQGTYDLAAEEEAPVYKLEHYLTSNHPWNSLSDYREEERVHYMTDNSYALEAAELVREKCARCDHVMIVGDDFVVPHYRRDISTFNWFTFWDQEDIEDIYTDIPYVKQVEREFSQLSELFKFNGQYDGKDILFIIPDTMDSQQQTALTKLKDVLERKYNPDMDEVKSSDVHCKEIALFDQFKGETLIVIGTEENNNAFDCFPFVEKLERRDVAFLDVNPWDGREHALIVNTENPEVFLSLSAMIGSEAHEQLTSKALWFVDVGITAASYASIACIFVGVPCDTIVDPVDNFNTCTIKQDYGMCGIGVSLMAVPYVPAGPVKGVIKGLFESIGAPFEKFVQKHGKDSLAYVTNIWKKGGMSAINKFELYFKRVTSYFPENIVDAVLKNADDYDSAIRGAEIGLKDVTSKNLDDFAKHLNSDSQKKLVLLKDIGTIEKTIGKSVADDVGKLHDINGVERLANNIRKNKITSGFIFEARAANVLKKETIEELGKDLTPFVGSGEIDILLKNGDVWEAKRGWGTLDKKSDKWIDETERWKRQIDRFRGYLSSSSTPDAEITYVFDSDVSQDLLDFFSNKNVKVKKIINNEVLDV